MFWALIWLRRGKASTEAGTFCFGIECRRECPSNYHIGFLRRSYSVLLLLLSTWGLDGCALGADDAEAWGNRGSRVGPDFFDCWLPIFSNAQRIFELGLYKMVILEMLDMRFWCVNHWGLVTSSSRRLAHTWQNEVTRNFGGIIVSLQNTLISFLMHALYYWILQTQRLTTSRH